MQSALSSIGRRLVAWLVLIGVALLALKLAVGLVVGLVQTVLVIGLALVAIAGVIWAVRHL
jgi:hypothetical protein